VSYKTDNKASIGLFGIDPSCGGKGFGKILIERVLFSLLKQGVETVSVATQGRNYAAQRLYQRAGFCNEKMEIYYHKWFPKSQGG
jgi:ribosomal protein S18 acetylase RimI-like enzyme